jgi:hypothetical protein
MQSCQRAATEAENEQTLFENRLQASHFTRKRVCRTLSNLFNVWHWKGIQKKVPSLAWHSMWSLRTVREHPSWDWNECDVQPSTPKVNVDYKPRKSIYYYITEVPYICLCVTKMYVKSMVTHCSVSMACLAILSQGAHFVTSRPGQFRKCVLLVRTYNFLWDKYEMLHYVMPQKPIEALQNLFQLNNKSITFSQRRTNWGSALWYQHCSKEGASLESSHYEIYPPRCSQKSRPE